MALLRSLCYTEAALFLAEHRDVKGVEFCQMLFLHHFNFFLRSVAVCYMYRFREH